MARYSALDYLKKRKRSGAAGGQETGVLGELGLFLPVKAIERIISAGVVLVGLGLGLMTFMDPPWWAICSPFLNVVGGALCFAFGVLSLLYGALCWLACSSDAALTRALGVFPFGVQPYRAAAGVVGCFLILALVWRKLPVLRRLGRVSLEGLVACVAFPLALTLLGVIGLSVCAAFGWGPYADGREPGDPVGVEMCAVGDLASSGKLPRRWVGIDGRRYARGDRERGIFWWDSRYGWQELRHDTLVPVPPGCR